MTNPVDQLSLEFDAEEVQLGTSFFEDGRIELDEDGPSFFEARVEHFKRQVFVWVDMDADEDGSRHGCDCPHFEDTGKGCEHLWALRLLLDGSQDGDDDDVDDDADEVPAHSFRPVYLAQTSESLRKNGLVLTLHDKNGGRIQMDHDTWATIHDDRDIAAIRELARLCGGWRDVRRGGGMYEPAGPWLIKTDEAQGLITKLLETERLTWGDGVETVHTPFLSAGATTVELGLRIHDNPVSIEGVLLQPGRTRGLAEAALLLPGSEPWVVLDQRLWPVRSFGGGAWARTLRTQATIQVPDGDAWRFLDEMTSAHALPRLVPDPGEPLPIEERRLRPSAGYREKGGQGYLSVAMAYGDTLAPIDQPGELLLSDNRRSQIRRQRDREASFLSHLLALGFEPLTSDPRVFQCEKRAARSCLVKLIKQDWEILHQGLPVASATAGRFAIRQGQDWFSLTGSVAVDDSDVNFAQVLRNFEPDTPWIRLDEDRVLLLDETSRRKLSRFAGLSSLGSDVDGELRFTSEQALLARLVLGDQPIPGAPELAEVEAALEQKLGEREEEPHPDFAGTLRPYQKSGLAWLSFLHGSGLGGCLADEMGLGKTVQVLALIQKLAAQTKRPFLVVAPLSLLKNWEREAGQFCPSLRVCQYHGSDRNLEGIKAADLVLTSYGILRRDAERLAAVGFELCILDEAQAIKNPQSKTRIAAMGLRAGSRIALSGTPLENRIDDLWSLLQFLNPSLFAAGASLQALKQVAENSNPENWRQALRPLLLRRRKEEVATDLPELTEQTILVSMSGDQEAAYRQIETAVRQSLLSNSGEKQPSLVLEGLLRLRQAACHPRLLPGVDKGRSGKAELLVDHVEDAFASSRKCLVFSQFVSLLDLVDESLQERGITSLRLDGTTKDRQEVVDDFEESPDPEVMLISLKAGGTGLNLTSAECVFLLDPWWNPAIESQAIARAHRIGQNRRVHAIRLVSEGTVEEKILELQARKKQLADSIIEAAPKALDGLSGADLRALLGA